MEEILSFGHWLKLRHQALRLTLSTPPQPRVLDELRMFAPVVKNDVMQ
jgi:hypothetical protein